jgi:hypothetical protein
VLTLYRFFASHLYSSVVLPLGVLTVIASHKFMASLFRLVIGDGGRERKFMLFYSSKPRGKR